MQDMTTRTQSANEDLRLGRLLEEARRSRGQLSIRAQDNLEEASSSLRSALEAQGHGPASQPQLIQPETGHATSPDEPSGGVQFAAETYDRIMARNADARALDLLSLTPDGQFFGKTFQDGRNAYLPCGFEERSGLSIEEAFPPSTTKGDTREPAERVLSCVPAGKLHDLWLKAFLRMDGHYIEQVRPAFEKGRIHPQAGLSGGAETQTAWNLFDSGNMELLVLNPAQVFVIPSRQSLGITDKDEIVILGTRSLIFFKASKHWMELPFSPEKLPYLIHFEKCHDSGEPRLRIGSCSHQLLKQIVLSTGSYGKIRELLEARNSFARDAAVHRVSSDATSLIYAVKKTEALKKSIADR